MHLEERLHLVDLNRHQWHRADLGVVALLTQGLTGVDGAAFPDDENSLRAVENTFVELLAPMLISGVPGVHFMD